MTRSIAQHVAAALLFVVLAAVMIRPLATSSSLLPDSDDALFSVWRLAWVAHQLPHDPAHLFDANIFYPHRNTLAYSDAMLLVGAAAAPFFWSGVDPVRIHNAVLLFAFASSMWCAYLLASRLTGDRLAGVLAGVVFGLCPYRFAHIGHLELQLVLFMPLALLALHRVIEAPSPARGLWLGTAIGLQTLCSVYYGAFLLVFIAIAAGFLTARHERPGRVVTCGLCAVLPLLAVVAIYGRPYLDSRQAMGPRRTTEVMTFSASWSDYLRVPPQNQLGGAIGLPIGDDEHSLFPGIVALCLAGFALFRPSSRHVWLYAALGVVAFDASLGPGGLVIGPLAAKLPMVTSLRSFARFGILVTLSVSLVAAFAAARVNRSWQWGRWLSVAAIVLAILESYSPIMTRGFSSAPTAVDDFLRTLPLDAVVLQLPLPRAEQLWLYETAHQVRSINHWRPMVNGYSGFAPADYQVTLNALTRFPDTPSLRRLREVGVQFVIVNRAYFTDDAYRLLGDALVESTEFANLQRVGHDNDEAIIAQVRY
jgi:hypothetical protein